MMLFFQLSMVQIAGTHIVHAAALLWVAGFGQVVARALERRAAAAVATPLVDPVEEVAGS